MELMNCLKFMKFLFFMIFKCLGYMWSWEIYCIFLFNFYVSGLVFLSNCLFVVFYIWEFICFIFFYIHNPSLIVLFLLDLGEGMYSITCDGIYAFGVVGFLCFISLSILCSPYGMLSFQVGGFFLFMVCFPSDEPMDLSMRGTGGQFSEVSSTSGGAGLPGGGVLPSSSFTVSSDLLVSEWLGLPNSVSADGNVVSSPSLVVNVGGSDGSTPSGSVHSVTSLYEVDALALEAQFSNVQLSSSSPSLGLGWLGDVPSRSVSPFSESSDQMFGSVVGSNVSKPSSLWSCEGDIESELVITRSNISYIKDMVTQLSGGADCYESGGGDSDYVHYLCVKLESLLDHRSSLQRQLKSLDMIKLRQRIKKLIDALDEGHSKGYEEVIVKGFRRNSV